MLAMSRYQSTCRVVFGVIVMVVLDWLMLNCPVDRSEEYRSRSAARSVN